MAKGKGHPPIKSIDWDTAEKLAAIFCTATEICSVIGVSEDTMLRRCKSKFKMTFAEWISQKRDRGKMSLRRKQYEMAAGGNPTMLIWLGKQYLNQTDKNEIDQTTTIKTVEPITVESAVLELNKYGFRLEKPDSTIDSDSETTQKKLESTRITSDRS